MSVGRAATRLIAARADPPTVHVPATGDEAAEVDVDVDVDVRYAGGGIRTAEGETGEPMGETTAEEESQEGETGVPTIATTAGGGARWSAESSSAPT